MISTKTAFAGGNGTLSPGMVTPRAAVNQFSLPEPTLWHRISKHPAVMPYVRWFALTAVLNLLLLMHGFSQGWWYSAAGALEPLSYLVLGNFAVAILIRQQYVINSLFWLATRVPVHWPLSIRWAMGKVYHFGGWHSGCATMGTLWFIGLLAAMTISVIQGTSSLSTATLAVSFMIFALLAGIVLTALPPIRGQFHNTFELIHRLGGWSTLLLFWVQTVLLARDFAAVDANAQVAFSEVLLNSPSVWVLALLTFSVLLPWLRLKKVAVDIKTPSSHVAVASFNYGVKPFAGSSTALSRSPLREWHSFANIPSPDDPGYRLTISRAGDWTGRFINDMPSHVWVKGIPTAGVGNVDQLFKKVLWVATGSGIGPCLPHLLARTAPANLIWSTRNPKETYGEDLLVQILKSQLDAVIWDTTKQGKPDMRKLVQEACLRFRPEAVICISNQKLTYQVVYDMESRGIPAFGAIWDS